MRRKLVAGNWKSNGNSQFVVELVSTLMEQERTIPSQVDVALCPPAVYVSQAGLMLTGSRIVLGAQDVSPYTEGAFTGEVSASMLKDVGCVYVIVGHSERRSLLAESDDLVKAKVEQAFEVGLTPILCLGETLSERQNGHTLQVCRTQLDKATVGLESAQIARLVVAYEPVWAIGTGETATLDQVQEVHEYLRGALRHRFASAADSTRIIYGGSVKAANASELFALPEVDGGLIGGASLIAEEFLAICKAGSTMNQDV